MESVKSFMFSGVLIALPTVFRYSNFCSDQLVLLQKVIVLMIFLRRSAPSPSPSSANRVIRSFYFLSPYSIYIKHKRGLARITYFVIMTTYLKIVIQVTSKGFNPKYIFHHPDVSSKNSSSNNYQRA